MNRRLLTMLAAGAAGAFAFAGATIAAPPGTNYNTPTSQEADCGDNGLSLVYNGPRSMWPPNHKYQDFSISGADDLANPATTLELVTTVTHDQYDGDTGTEEKGAGNTMDDARVNPAENGGSPDESSTANAPAYAESGDDSVTTDWQARSERSGRLKEGRTYTITGTLTEMPAGRSCSGTWTIKVPHDQRPANREG